MKDGSILTDGTLEEQKRLFKGSEYQDFVALQCMKIGIPIIFTTTYTNQNKYGESLNGYEIKFDDNFRKTGNLYFEYEERRQNKDNWTKSGIKKEDNTWIYIIGDYKTIFFFSKNTLNKITDFIDKGGKIDGKTKEDLKKQIDTSRGYVIPVTWLRKYKYIEKEIKIYTRNEDMK
jgi:hypothetical protein